MYMASAPVRGAACESSRGHWKQCAAEAPAARGDDHMRSRGRTARSGRRRRIALRVRMAIMTRRINCERRFVKSSAAPQMPLYQQEDTKGYAGTSRSRLAAAQGNVRRADGHI